MVESSLSRRLPTNSPKPNSPNGQFPAAVDWWLNEDRQQPSICIALVAALGTTSALVAALGTTSALVLAMGTTSTDVNT